MDKEKLAELVMRVKNGDAEAMNEIYSATAKPIFYYCKNVLGDGDPENAVTKIYNSIEKNIASLDDAGSFMQYLRMSAVKYCVSKLAIPSDAWALADADGLPDVAEVNPDDIINQIVYCDQIKSVIPTMMTDLQAPERICAYSYYYFGMSQAWIAAIAEVPEADVNARLKSVRFGIKTNMKFYSNLSEDEADDLAFSRQLIRDFLYADAAKSAFSAIREDAARGQLRTYSFNVPPKEVIQPQKSVQTKKIQQTPARMGRPSPAEKLPNQKKAEEELIALAHEQQANAERPDKNKALKKNTAANKKTLIILIVIIVLALAFLIAGIIIAVDILGKEPPSKDVALESLNFNELQVTIDLGKTYTLTPVYAPEDTTVKDLGWDVQDTSIVSLDEKTGLLTAKAVGTTLVRAYSLYYTDAEDNPIFAYCEVTVVCAAEVIRFENKNITAEPGDVLTLEPIIYPVAAEASVSWTSSDDKVASVSDGKITALKEGVAAITCYYDENIFDICVVNVSKKNIPVTNIKLDKETMQMKMSDRVTLTATVTPADATDKTLVWDSSNPEIATVKDGVITPVAPGTTIIAVYSNSQMAATGNKENIKYCTVTVLSDKIAVTEIKLIQSTLDLKVGESRVLGGYCTVMPADATNKGLVFEIMSGATISMVDAQGIFTALGEGTVFVYVTSADNANIYQLLTINITKK